MRSLALAVLVALLAAPFVVAEGLQGSAPFGASAPHTPQAYCIVVQTSPGAQRCQIFNVEVRGIHVLRARIAGEGHVFAYADKIMGGGVNQEIGRVDCRAEMKAPTVPEILRLDPKAPGFRSCATVFASGAGFSGPHQLHVFVDGPGRAVYEVTLESVLVSLP